MSQNHSVQITINARNLSTPEFQKVIADLRGMGTAADVAASDLGDVGNAARKAGGDLKSVESGANTAAGSLRRIVETAAGVAIGNMLQDAPRMMMDFGKASFNAASDFQENMSRIEVVFGDASDSIVQWSEDAVEAFGLSQSAAIGAAGEFGNLFTSMGLGQGVAADMSTEIVQLAADLGSFNNIGTDQALEKLRAGLVGEIEPLRSLGVNINAVMVQQKAMTLGLADTAKELTAADKAQASYALILEQTTNAQGDFARTSDGAANSLKSLDASVGDLQVAIGTMLTPAVADYAQTMTDNIQTMTTWIEKIREADGAVGDLSNRLGAEGDQGPLSKWIEVVRKGGPQLFLLREGIDFYRDGINDLRGDQDGATASLQDFVTWIEKAVNAARGIEELTVFQQVFRDIQEQLVETGTEYERFTTQQALADRKMAASSSDLSAATSRQAEFAGQANERNTEFFHSLELGSGAAAEMAFHVAKVAEAQNELASAYQSGLKGMATFNDQSSEYAGIQSTLEKGYDAILKKQENNIKLTDEEQLLLDRYPTLYGRLEGAQDDAAIQAGLFAAANTEVMLAQDDLNAAIARGEENLDPYIERLNNAHALVGDQAMADPMIQSLNSLTGTVTTVLIPAILDMTRHIEYIAKPWLVEIDAATEAAEAELLRILGLINQINSSTAAPYMPGVGDPGGGQKFAEGGIVDRPTFAMVGEDGPELVLPLTKPDRMKTLLQAAGFPMMADGGGYLGASPNTGVNGGAGLNITVNVEPIDWNPLFAGLDTAAEDYAAKASDRIASFLSGIDLDNILVEQADLDLTVAQLQAVFDGLVQIGETTAASALAAEITALRIESETLASIIGTDAVQAWLANEDAAKAAAEAAKEAVEAAERLLDFREEVVGGLNFDDMLSQQTALSDLQIELNTLIKAAEELGDVETAARLQEQFNAAHAEAVLLNEVIGTEAVQAWIAWNAEIEAAEEATRAATEAALAYADVISGISSTGGLDSVAESFRDAQLALQTAALTPGISPETMAALQESYDAALLALQQYEDAFLVALENGLFTQEELMDQAQQGGDTLWAILMENMLTEEQLQELLESGDEAIRQLMERFFGEDTIAAWEAGWADLSDASVAALGELIAQMEDGGAGIADTLVDAVTSGAMSYEEALALYGDATGEEVNEILTELETLRDALVVQLFEATAAGAVEMAAELTAQLGIVDQLLADLASRAVSTAVAMQGLSMAMGGSPGGAANALEELEGAIRDANDAAYEMAGLEIAEAWKAGTITLEEAEIALAAVGDQMDEVGNAAKSASNEVRKLSGALDQAIVDSFIFAGQPGSRSASKYEEMLDGLLGRMHEAMALDPEAFADEYATAFERIQDALQEATLLGRGDDITRLTAQFREMIRVANTLGIDLSEVLGTGIEDAAAQAVKSVENVIPEMQDIIGQSGVTPLPGHPLTTGHQLPSITQALIDSAETQGRIIGGFVDDAIRGSIPAIAAAVREGSLTGTLEGYRKMQSGTRMTTSLVS